MIMEADRSGFLIYGLQIKFCYLAIYRYATTLNCSTTLVHFFSCLIYEGEMPSDTGGDADKERLLYEGNFSFLLNLVALQFIVALHNYSQHWYISLCASYKRRISCSFILGSQKDISGFPVYDTDKFAFY